MFGVRLRALRESQGLTQNDLATKLNTARTTITLYENSTNEPDFKMLVRIADIFNVSLDYLLCRTENKYNSSLSDKLETQNKEIVSQIHNLLDELKY